jgi:hypothetical protein
MPRPHKPVQLFCPTLLDVVPKFELYDDRLFGRFCAATLPDCRHTCTQYSTEVAWSKRRLPAVNLAESVERGHTALLVRLPASASCHGCQVAQVQATKSLVSRARDLTARLKPNDAHLQTQRCSYERRTGMGTGSIFTDARFPNFALLHVQ